MMMLRGVDYGLCAPAQWLFTTYELFRTDFLIKHQLSAQDPIYIIISVFFIAALQLTLS